MWKVWKYCSCWYLTHYPLSDSYFEYSDCPFIRRLMFPVLQSLLKYSSSSSHGCTHSLMSYIFLKRKRKRHDAWRNDKKIRGPPFHVQGFFHPTMRAWPWRNDSWPVTTETWTTVDGVRVVVGGRIRAAED